MSPSGGILNISEKEALKVFTDGSIDEDLDSELCSSASLNYSRSPRIAVDDLIRIYYVVSEGKETERHALFTGIADRPTTTLSSRTENGSISLSSTLAVLKDELLDNTYSLLPGTSAVTRTIEIIKSYGLACASQAPQDDPKTSETQTFEAGTSPLEVVKWLLDFAGYSPPATDGMGVVLLSKKIDRVDRPWFTFRDDEQSIILSDVTVEAAMQTVPNVVKAVYSSSGANPLVATAENNDPNSPYSTVSRARRVVSKLDVSDVVGVSNAYKLQSLQKAADEELSKLSSVAKLVTFEHAWRPYQLGQGLALEYSGAGLTESGVAIARSIKLTPSALTQTKIRRYLDWSGQ
jgi:hypothetical protein